MRSRSRALYGHVKPHYAKDRALGPVPTNSPVRERKREHTQESRAQSDQARTAIKLQWLPGRVFDLANEIFSTVEFTPRAIYPRVYADPLDRSDCLARGKIESRW